MSRLSDARAALVSALRTGGVRAQTAGRFSAPVVIVEPGDSWSEPVRMPGRDSRWQLTIVAGAGDSDAAFDELAEIVDRVDAAIRDARLAGCGYPTWSKPLPWGADSLPAVVGVLTYTLRD